MLPSAFGSSATSNRGSIIAGMQPAGGRSSWTASSQDERTQAYDRFRNSRDPVPNIKDLQDQAAHLEVDETSPVSSLCTNATRYRLAG